MSNVLVTNLFILKATLRDETEANYLIDSNPNNNPEIQKTIDSFHKEFKYGIFNDYLGAPTSIKSWLLYSDLSNYKNQLDSLGIRHITMTRKAYYEMLNGVLPTKKQKKVFTDQQKQDWVANLKLQVTLRIQKTGALVSVNKSSELVKQIIRAAVLPEKREWIPETFSWYLFEDYDVETIKKAFQRNDIPFILI